MTDQPIPLACLPVAVEDRQRSFYYRPTSRSDSRIIRHIFNRRDYELRHFRHYRALRKHYDRVVAKGRTPLIVDAGANIGASVVWYHLNFGHAHIVALEPEKRNCHVLRRNCTGLDCEIVEGGIASRDGEMFLQDPDKRDWSFRVGSEGGKYPVPVFAANALVKDRIAKGFVPFIFKIDIEGGEAELFSQDTDWASLFPVLAIEIHDWMMPGASISKKFLEVISRLDCDLCLCRENLMVFNYKLFKRRRKNPKPSV